jgi:hypothetical protein
MLSLYPNLRILGIHVKLKTFIDSKLKSDSTDNIVKYKKAISLILSSCSDMFIQLWD